MVMTENTTIELIRKDIGETALRLKSHRDKAAACEARLAELNAALRVIERLYGVKESQAKTHSDSPVNTTTSQQVIDCLKEFGPLTTAELVEKVNSRRTIPSTHGTIGVAASRLKQAGKLSHDGKRWLIKTNEAQTESTESAPIVTEEAQTSSNESPTSQNRLLD